jgi:hemerythrin-like domain-containing protein
MPNAIELLSNDHQRVRELLGRLETAAPGWQRTDLLDEVARALELHSRQEEEVFYPEFRRGTRTAESERIYYRALDEHHLVEQTLEDLQRTDPRSEQFAARARVLRQLVEPHVDEEEKLMFPLARQIFEPQQLDAIGARMQALRTQQETEDEACGPQERSGGERPRQARPRPRAQRSRSQQRGGGGSGRVASACNGLRLGLPSAWCSWLC